MTTTHPTTPAPVTDAGLSFTVHALADAVLEDVRNSGVDVWGYPVQRLVADGGEPLRCCLRDATDGEAILLFGYEPPMPASPYRERGAVFVHAQRCAGPERAGYPTGWRGRRQILRAYDRRGWIHPATREHDGHDPETVITEILADPDVERIHSRNVAYGCYMFEITRASVAAVNSP